MERELTERLTQQDQWWDNSHNSKNNSFYAKVRLIGKPYTETKQPTERQEGTKYI